jgi:hypothetical protein
MAEPDLDAERRTRMALNEEALNRMGLKTSLQKCVKAAEKPARQPRKENIDKTTIVPRRSGRVKENAVVKETDEESEDDTQEPGRVCEPVVRRIDHAGQSRLTSFLHNF